jgi:hypothetical protein
MPDRHSGARIDAMPERGEGRASRGAVRYRIVVRGPMSPSLLRLLEETTIGESGSASVLSCDIVDQSRLQAVLGWLAFENVEIVSVEPLQGLADDSSAGPDPPGGSDPVLER